MGLYKLRVVHRSGTACPQRGYNEKWTEGCISFNDSVLEYLKSAESVKVVVFSSPFKSYLDSNAHSFKRKNLGSGFEVISGGAAVALGVMKSTIDKLHSIGKKVVIVGPPPSGGFDMGLCAERMDAGLMTMGSAKGCKFSVDTYHKKSSSEVTALAKFVLSGARTEPLICFPFGGRSVDMQFEAHAGVKSIW